jgi:hypothetical protein
VDILALLVQFHSVWRYAVLLAAVVSIVRAVVAWFGSFGLPFSSRQAALPYIIAIDIQVLVGLILWVSKGWYAIPGFYRAEHPATMVLALIAAHAGQVLAKRARSEKAAARTVAIAIVVSLVLVLVGIPGVVRGG